MGIFSKGKKETAKEMLTLLDEILSLNHYLNLFHSYDEKEKLRRFGNKKAENQYVSEIIQKLEKKLNKLLQFTYTEARLEEVMKQIIQQSKNDLIKLIQEDEAFTKDQQAATLCLQNIKSHVDLASQGRTSLPNRNLIINVKNLRELLVQEANIEQAMQVISQDLEKLMQTLRKAEK